MQIPIFEGTKTTTTDYETTYPQNMVAVPKDTGISQGYLATTDGISQQFAVPGLPRGAVINQKSGAHYRVHDGVLYLVELSGVTNKGAIAGSGFVPMAAGYDFIAFCGANTGYAFDGTTLTNTLKLQSNPLITYSAKDVVWVNQFFMWTDGEQIFQSTLTDPLTITGFADAESSPDVITGLVATRDELMVCGKSTIERFRNVGAGTFTFRAVAGGVLDKGVVSPSAKVSFENTFAFVGGGREEAVSVWIYAGSQAQKIATRDIERVLETVDVTQIVMDYYTSGIHQFILMKLPNGTTYVYDRASDMWHTRTWDAQNIVYWQSGWYVGGNGKIGKLGGSSEWGSKVWRQFSTKFMPSSSAVRVAKLELKGNWGRYQVGENPQVEMETSKDGIDWSQKRVYSLGSAAVYDFRPCWRNVAFLRAGEYMAMRFAVYSPSPFQVSALEINE